MLPSSMARQLAGTMGVQLAHLRTSAGQWRTFHAFKAAQRGGFHPPAVLKARAAELGLPAGVKSPRAVVAVLDGVPVIEGLFTAEVAERAGVSFSTAQVALNVLRDIGWATVEQSRSRSGSLAFKWSVNRGNRH